MSLCAPVPAMQASGLYKVEVLQASGLYNNFPIICIFQGNPLPLPSSCFSKPHPLVIKTENNN